MPGSSFHITSLKPKLLNEMYFTFLDSFSDYPVHFQLSKDQFVRKFVQKLQLDFELSVGVYDYDALIGFLFTSTNNYENKRTAYNGGTGVRPKYRGNKLTSKMYDHCMPLFYNKKIKQCILEVLSINHTARKVYHDIGFKDTKKLISYKLKNTLGYRPISVDLHFRHVDTARWPAYNMFKDFSPTYLDSDEVIKQLESSHEIVEAYLEDELVGYAIFHASYGRINQIAIKPHYRGRHIGYHLVKYVFEKCNNQELNILNVDHRNEDLRSFLLNVGFKPILEQFEMKMEI